jgi:lipoprotein-anchoring transpeptidase ErfK/SrfK
MPYFMRLSCLDFGMHEGVVPNYPASHGCIRLPSEAARKLFAEIPVGTLVTVQ